MAIIIYDSELIIYDPNLVATHHYDRAWIQVFQVPDPLAIKGYSFIYDYSILIEKLNLSSELRVIDNRTSI